MKYRLLIPALLAFAVTGAAAQVSDDGTAPALSAASPRPLEQRTAIRILTCGATLDAPSR